MMSASLQRRHRHSAIFRWLCACFTWLALLVLFILIVHILLQGFEWVDMQFLASFPSRFPEKAGIKSALWGTVWLLGLTGLISVPIGVGAAIYLEEFSPKNRVNMLIEINIANLAGVPSIVYGILGLAIFVRWMDLGRSVLAGSLTMSLLILPIIIMASRESIRAVSDSIRYAALALGATKWQTVRAHVLPSALPGILTGMILAMSRTIGETAPLLMIGALTFVAFTPDGPMDSFTALPIQIFNWASRPQEEFHQLAAGAIIVLLLVLLLMNVTAVVIRQKYERGNK